MGATFQRDRLASVHNDGEAAMRLSIVLVACVLSACTPSRQQAVELSGMNVDQLAAANDKAICNRRASGPAIDAERMKRGLADCGPGAMECRQAGYMPGSPQYLPCRQIYMQQDQAARDRRARIMAEPTTTTCRRIGDQVYCQHY
jgi:hypothetical protein